MKEITIRVKVSDSGKMVATRIDKKNFDEESMSDCLLLIGALENLKQGELQDIKIKLKTEQ